MVAMLQNAIGQRDITRWIPWTLGAMLLLYFVGYTDGTVHGAAFGAAGTKLAYVHEFFHHGRHLILMCH